MGEELLTLTIGLIARTDFFDFHHCIVATLHLVHGISTFPTPVALAIVGQINKPVRVKMDFDLTLKKKKKKKQALPADLPIDAPAETSLPSPSSEPDPEEEMLGMYTYAHLLQRAMSQVPERKRQTLERPTMECDKRWSVVQNFKDFCCQVGRHQVYVKTYFEDELSTTCRIDIKEQLHIRGKYREDVLLKLFKKFVQEKVKCATCKGLNTVPTKFGFIECCDCGHKRSVK